MKKICVFTVLFLFSLTALVFAEGELNLWTWEGYAPDELVQQFEEETGIKVNITYYSNNNELISKLRAAKGRGADLKTRTPFCRSAYRRRWGLTRLFVGRVVLLWRHLQTVRDPDAGR